MLIHQKDSKSIVKSNFVTLCLVFRGTIPTYIRSLDSDSKKEFNGDNPWYP